MTRSGDGVRRARLLALVVACALIAGALGSQYLGGLYPCEMCHWQRWPLYAAILLALAAFARPAAAMPLTVLAGLAIALSGAIGAFHAGVEYGWWEGLTRCSTGTAASGADLLKEIMATPMIRCDEAQWRLIGISLAGWNALISLPVGLITVWLCLKRR